MTELTDEIVVGQQREFYTPSRRDPHVVLRMSELTGEVYIKFSDKTTEWHQKGQYQRETRPVAGPGTDPGGP